MFRPRLCLAMHNWSYTCLRIPAIHTARCVYSIVPCMVTGQLADKPTRGQSSHGLVN